MGLSQVPAPTESDRLTERVNRLIEELANTPASVLSVREIAWITRHLTRPMFISDKQAAYLYDELVKFRDEVALRENERDAARVVVGAVRAIDWTLHGRRDMPRDLRESIAEFDATQKKQSDGA